MALGFFFLVLVLGRTLSLVNWVVRARVLPLWIVGGISAGGGVYGFDVVDEF